MENVFLSSRQQYDWYFPLTGIKKKHESFESIFKDRRGRPIHLSRLVFLPFRRGHMVFSIFHNVVRCARKETGKGKYSKEEDGRNADINEDGGEYWSTLKDEEYNGGEELPRERLISLSEKFRRAGHLSTYAPVPFLPLLLSLLSRQILQRPFSSRESLFNQIGRRGDAKTRGKTETGTSTSTGWEMMIHKPDVTEKIRFDTCRTVWK